MNTHVLAFGTFDGLHAGHLFFLRAARSLGSTLTVVVARDQDVRELKQKEPQFDENTRLAAVSALSYVNATRLSDEVRGAFIVIQEVQPDVIALGHDQNELETALRLWMEAKNITIPLQHVDEMSFETCTNCTCGHG